MDDGRLVSVQKASKKFCRNLRRSMYYGTMDVMKGMIGLPSGTDRLRRDEFWALESVSFQLGRGESIGLLGDNGSGKSTLLRLLGGIFPPDRGRIELRGRVGSLLALGAGFHLLMSGRENIYLNGAILGMDRREIDRKFGAIAEWAGLGDFLDAPVRTYSAGMFVRLGFAIAIEAEPDVLLIDEVLAAADARFRERCLERITELRDRGTAVVFVSHSLDAVERVCRECILLEKGRMVFRGDTKESLERYLKKTHSA